MAENTKIEWADHTFNPRKRTAPSTWAQPRRWNAEAERLGVRYRVFCASLADVFDNEVPAEWRRDLFDLIASTPNLDWLLVTKRIGNAKTMMADALHLNPTALSDGLILPLPNVWIGATITSQAEADRDIPKLLQTPAAVRFLSMEPLLGPVMIDTFLGEYPEDEDGAPYPGCLDWVIVGGESGTGARPMHPQWVRNIRDQCAAAEVPFLFKQWGEWTPGENVCAERGVVKSAILFDGKWLLGEEDLACEDGHVDDEPDLYRVAKKAAGRLLDGIEHNGFPVGGKS